MAENIRKYRKLAGLSQAELGTRLGTGAKNVSKFEQGAHNLRLDTVEEVARALNIRPHLLLEPPTTSTLSPAECLHEAMRLLSALSRALVPQQD